MAMFDLQKTGELARLFDVSREARDANWIAAFYRAVPEASLSTRPEQIFAGPDGFRYFALYLPPANEQFDAFCVAHILSPCLEHGLGCVIDPDKSPPDWVFTYGNLWSLHSYGSFDASPPPTDAQPAPKAGRQVLIASPSEQFLPAFARRILKSWLEHVGVKNPSVLLINDSQAMPSQSLAFSIYREDFENDATFNSVLNRLKNWFLPPHYGLIVLPSKADYASSMVAL